MNLINMQNKLTKNIIILGAVASAVFLSLFLPSISVAQDYGCTSHAYQSCSGNNLYWYNSCGNQQEIAQYCLNGCNGNTCQNYNNYGNCTYHSYQSCSGNNLYWYDSCGNQQGIAQYCSNGCYGNSCQNNNNYNNYGNCTYHAYRSCVGNNIYWFNSCQQQQDLYQSCGGLYCQYGQCVNSIVNPINNNYNPNAKLSCYGGSIHWFDSLGAESGLYRSCSDSNSCTADSCSGTTCYNSLTCNGSTCAVGSTDYVKYCGSNPINNNENNNNNSVQCGNGLCETTIGETSGNCPTDCKIMTPSGLSTSFFAKFDVGSTQWQKNIQISENSQAYFIITVANNSSSQVNNVLVSINMPAEVTSLGNVQINGVPVSGDIVSGINIGSITASTAKSVTFEGRTQTIPTAVDKQATATVDISGAGQSDSIAISFIPGNNPQGSSAAVSSVQAASGFWAFLKKWYLWILVALVLIFLFIIVFRRLSS